MLIAIYLLVLTTVDGVEVSINPAQIVRLQPTSEAARQAPNVVVAPGARCVVSTADGKFVSVREECAAIRRRLEESK